MIKEICDEIDNVIFKDADYSHLRELVMSIISNNKNLPEKFVDMVYDIHEADSFTAESEKMAREDNLNPPQWFIDFLKETKEKNIEFWEESEKNTMS